MSDKISIKELANNEEMLEKFLENPELFDQLDEEEIRRNAAKLDPSKITEQSIAEDIMAELNQNPKMQAEFEEMGREFEKLQKEGIGALKKHQ